MFSSYRLCVVQGMRCAYGAMPPVRYLAAWVSLLCYTLLHAVLISALRVIPPYQTHRLERSFYAFATCRSCR